MILVTRLQHQNKGQAQLRLNAELIMTIQSTPDTLITLTNGHQFLVAESEETVVERIMEYRRAICRQEGLTTAGRE